MTRIPPKTDDEEAMLELAVDVQPTSRLSCQIMAAPELDGLKLRLAPGTEI
jgi:ferredoxin